ncbi:MAG: nucleotidyltransferase domain-containing protein [Candidatus Omnitrophica bacterium]|nr:nucleotidyltransferase domain-containing protein [Candidatus Omnitrophota bacterium]
MAIEKSLDNILSSRSKIAIIRLFISKTDDFKASGREIAKIVNLSPQTAHTALKDLYNQGVLKLDIIGKQHIYNLDSKNRTVKEMLRPMFEKEISVKEEIKDYLIKQIKQVDIQNKIISCILYGSVEKGETSDSSDVDVAVITGNEKDKTEVEEIFLNNITVNFKEYFKLNLDAYIKTKDEFRLRLKKNLPPVSTLMKSYSVIWGSEPLDI